MGRPGSGTTTGSARFGSVGRAPPGSCSSLASRLSRLSPGTSETSRTRTSRTSRSIRSASQYRAIAGGPPQGPPTAQHFWAVSASGVGQQTVTWEVREGDWSVVLMNADGSRRVVADIDLGAKLSFLLWLAIGLLLGGGFVLVGSTALIVLAARRRQAPPMPPAPATASSGATSAPASEDADRPDRATARLKRRLAERPAGARRRAAGSDRTVGVRRPTRGSRAGGVFVAVS